MVRSLGKSFSGIFAAALSAGLLAYGADSIFKALEARHAGEAARSGEGRGGRARRERVYAVNVVMAQPGAETPELVGYGEVRSRRVLELRAPASGLVQEIGESFVDGGEVGAGDVLLRLDPATSRAALARAQSALLDADQERRDSARAVELARDDLAASQEQAELRDQAATRQEGLLERGVGAAAAQESAALAAAAARQAVVSRRAALAQAQARVARAQSAHARALVERDEARRVLDETVLRAPFDGALSDVAVSLGRRVGVNERLGTLLDPHALEVSLRISTVQYARLLDENGALLPLPVRAELDPGGAALTAQGRLVRAGAAMAEGQSGRVVYARLNGAGALKPGDFVTIRIDEPPIANAIRLPARALGADGQVLALGPEGRLVAVPVVLVRRQGNDVLVRARHLAGRQVVAERSAVLGPGIRVRAAGGEPVQGAKKDSQPADNNEEITLEPSRRERLLAFVKANARMPEEARARALAALTKERVPRALVERLEQRMGR